MGLSTFDFAIIMVTDNDEIPFWNGGKAQPGPAFITRAESGDAWSGKAKQLDKLTNSQDISRLVAFDTWTLNCDRYSWPVHGEPSRSRINRNNVFFSEEAPDGVLMLKAMDHTHCFTCGRALSLDLRNIDNIKDQRLFGLFPQFRKLQERRFVQRAANDLRKLTRTDVGRIVRHIPKEWDVPTVAQDALIDLIVGRAAYVAETIETQLWPQNDLGFDNAGETEQPS